MSAREYPDRPWIGIGCVVLRGDEVLLVRRGRPPRAGEWSVPGGAQHLGEGAEDCARREVLEESGIALGPLFPCVVVDAIDRDAGGGVRFHYTILDFCARWRAGEPVAGDDALEARFFAPDQLDGLGLWSEAHRAIAAARAVLAREDG